MSLKLIVVLGAAGAAIFYLVRQALRYQDFLLQRRQCEMLIERKLREHQAMTHELEKAKSEMERSKRRSGPQAAVPR